MEPMTASSPRVVAHRGASHDKAEHTLGAYLAALEAGADGLECDVRLTADGHLVCVHDRTLTRTASTRGLVSTMNLAELNELDFASWKNPWAELDDEAPDRDETLDAPKSSYLLAADDTAPFELNTDARPPAPSAHLYSSHWHSIHTAPPSLAPVRR